MASIRFLSVITFLLVNFYKVDSLGNLLGNLLIPTKGQLFERCSTQMDCTYREIDQIPMRYRADMLRKWQDKMSTVIPSENGFKKWEALAGVIEFFVVQNWGQEGTWVSIVDAAILEGVERGVAMYLSSSDTRDFGNPGAHLWTQYLIDLKAGNLGLKSTHDRRWSESEQASTEHGVESARNMGVVPTDTQQVVYEYSDGYRYILRNEEEWEPKFSDMCFKLFFNWFTNVEDNQPTFIGGNAVVLVSPTYEYLNPFDMLTLIHEYYISVNPNHCPVGI